MRWVPRRDLRSRLYTESQQIQEMLCGLGIRITAAHSQSWWTGLGFRWSPGKEDTGYRHLRGAASPQHSDHTVNEVFSVSVTLFSDTQYLLPVASVGCCHLGWGVRGTSRLFVVVQSSNRVRLFVIPGTEACQASLSLIISRSLPKFVCIELVMPSNHLIRCCLLLLLSSIFWKWGANQVGYPHKVPPVSTAEPG